MRLVLQRDGKLYIHISFMWRCRGDIVRAPPDSLCSIDPGVRTLLTVYSPNGVVEELGKRSASSLIRDFAGRIDQNQ